jgi:hypothetical protein
MCSETEFLHSKLVRFAASYYLAGEEVGFP